MRPWNRKKTKITISMPIKKINKIFYYTHNNNIREDREVIILASRLIIKIKFFLNKITFITLRHTPSFTLIGTEKLESTNEH